MVMGTIDFNRADITLHNDLDASVTGIEVTTNAAVTGKSLQLDVSSDTGAALGLLAHKYMDDTEGKGRITLGETGGANLIKVTAGGGNARALLLLKNKLNWRLKVLTIQKLFLL